MTPNRILNLTETSTNPKSELDLRKA